jgi:hypothetical protein
VDGRLAFLAMSVNGSSDSAPTESQYQLLDRLKKQTDEFLSHWEQVRTSDLAQFQKLASDQGLHAVYVPDVKSERVQGSNRAGADEE